MYPGILLAILTIIIPSSFRLQAQDTAGGKIAGVVLEQGSGRPLAYVNVVLLKQIDSSIVRGTVTDKNGKYEISGIPDGSYVVRYRLIGYKEKNSVLFEIGPQHDRLNMGTVRLVETTVTLDDVLVTGKQQLFNNQIDRKVYNVEQDIASTSGSAADLLQNIPSIEVDLDGNVSLRGSSGVLILINGKNSPLMGKSRATVLQSMPANSIDRIEVLTNPSAKYRPEGTSGIINIILKKNGSVGTNGTIAANAGNNSRYNGNVRINYSPGDYNLFATYALRADRRDRFRTDSRDLFDPASASRSYREDFSSYSSPLSHTISLGMDYDVGDNDNFGLAGNYFYNGFTRNDTSRKVYRDIGAVPISSFDRDRHDIEYEKEYGFTLTYEHKFEDEGHKLALELTGSDAPEVEDNHFSNFFRIPPAATQYDNTLIRQSEGQYQLTIDYTNPLANDSKLEAGYNGELNSRDMDFIVSDFDPVSQSFVTNKGETNHFLFDESIHALYATYQHSFGPFGFLAGMRLEGSFRKSNLLTLDSTITDSYFSIYPTAHFSYKVRDGIELQLNYSRRTRRPEGDDLNPFPEYRDPQNISAGNPRLLPEYIHSVEFGLKFENDAFSLLPSVYYRSTHNRFTQVTTPLNDSTLLTTEANLASDEAAGFELIATANTGDFLTTHANVNAFFNRIDASNLGYGSNKATVSWSGAITVDIHAMPTSTIQINSNYRAKRLTPQGENQSSFIVNLGFRQELIERRLFLVATVSDVFKTLRSESSLATTLLNQSVTNTRDSRIFYLGITYNFGVLPKNGKEQSIKYDESL